MAKTVRIIEDLTCDLCIPLFQEQEARVVTEVNIEQVILPDGKKMEAEVCDVCKVKLYDPVYSAFRMLGREVGLTAEEAARELIHSVVSNPTSGTASPQPVEAPLAPEQAPPAPQGGVMAQGRGKPSGGRVMPKGEACLMPRCDYEAPVGSRNGLSMHVKGRHDIGLKLMFGSTCPLCNETTNPALGLGFHTKDEHGLTPAMAFSKAEYVEDDPHGVVAARKKALAR